MVGTSPLQGEVEAMAPVGTVVDIVSFLYAFGNTPAVNFTQELAPESSARILLLGWGDMRNVLFTTYSNSNGRCHL